MERARLITAALSAILHACVTISAAASEPKTAPAHGFLIPERANALLDRYCYTCHDDETQKGDTRLDNLADLENSKRLELLNRIQEQLYFLQMPRE